MKTKIFAVKFAIEDIINMSGRAIYAITVNKKIIGYIAKNETGLEQVITPFTATGELSESHCLYCAAGDLFTCYSGVPREAFDAADAQEEPQPLGSLLITVMAARNRATRH